MLIGQRLRELRELKKLSQGHIEQRTGLLRCYISRVENGHTVPAIETLEKLARALELPLHELFRDADTPLEKLHLSSPVDGDSNLWGTKPKERQQIKLFAKALARMNRRDRELLMKMAATMAGSRNQSKQV